MTEQAAAEEQRGSGNMNRGFFGHPWGLANLAGLELWERFSFYGMQGLLIYYLYYSLAKGGLGLPESAANSIVGAYGGAVYLSAILGAWFADRVFGAERTLTFAAVLIMIGHIGLAVIPGISGVFVGLICVALGSGSLKTTTSSVLGDMYDLKDDRRDAGFSLYYMAVNIGAFVGPLLTGRAWQLHGFHWGFGLAAIGIAVGLAQYLVLRRRTLGNAGKKINNPLDRATAVRFGVAAAVAVVLIIVLVLIGVITAERLSGIVVVITAAAALILFVVILSNRKISTIERRRVISFIPMFVASVAFWSLFQQQFTVVAIYSDKRLNRTIFGWQMPPNITQSIEPIFVIIFAGLFALMWTKLGPRQPSSPIKFALGTIIMGIAFLLFLPFAGSGPNGTPLVWLVFILFMFCMAELLLSPVGQSLSTKLAPARFHSQMIALFFLSIAIGSSAAGALAGLYTTKNDLVYFSLLGAASIVVGAILFVLSPWIRRMMGGVH